MTVCGHVLIAVALQVSPVELGPGDRKSVVGGILDRMGETGAVPHDLLGHAADVDARATESSGLDQRALGTVACRAIGNGDASAAAANGEKVKVSCHDMEWRAYPQSTIAPSIKEIIVQMQ